MEEDAFVAPQPKAGEAWDVVIIGSGPAALTAAIYTTRGAASTLILAGEAWGGQLMLTSNVDNFPGFPEGVLGPDLMQKMRTQAEKFGAQIIEQTATSVDVAKKPFEVVSISGRYLGKTIIVATGAATRWLDAPGVKEYIGRGISSCAPCDAPFFKEKVVAVVGGGDSAMDEAAILTKYASQVYLIHRRAEFRASKVMQDKVLSNPKIKILWNTEVIEVEGDSKLNKLKLKNNVDNNIVELPVDGLFIAIGHKPESDIFAGKIEVDGKGYIKKTQNLNLKSQNSFIYSSATSVPGIFVAGDVNDYTYKQAVTAAGFGCQAGMDTLHFLEEAKSA